MAEEQNRNQIIRKDARGCFVESLDDYFHMGKAHLLFAAYDMNRPPGQRQTDSINIFIGVGELQEICRKLSSGELRWLMDQKRNANDQTPLMEWLGGTSAEKLARLGRARQDGMSLSRTAKLLCGNRTDFLFVAASGPGEQSQKGLIVPRFGKNPENHVTVSLAWDALSELFLLTREHYQAWLSARYFASMSGQQAQQDGGQARGGYQADGNQYQQPYQSDGNQYQQPYQAGGNQYQADGTQYQGGYQTGTPQDQGAYQTDGAQYQAPPAGNTVQYPGGQGYQTGQPADAYQGNNLFQYPEQYRQAG